MTSYDAIKHIKDKIAAGADLRIIIHTVINILERARTDVQKLEALKIIAEELNNVAKRYDEIG